jgi:hypothetical protein
MRTQSEDPCISPWNFLHHIFPPPNHPPNTPKKKKICQSQRHLSKVCAVLNGQNVPCDTEGTDKHSPLLNSNPKFKEHWYYYYVLLQISQPSFHDKINIPEIGFGINIRHRWIILVDGIYYEDKFPLNQSR